MMHKSGTKTRREFVKDCLVMTAGGMLAGAGCGRQGATPTTPTAGGGPQPFEPAYLALHRSGELKQRADALWARMEECDLCPRKCGANRLSGEQGECRTTVKLVVSSHHPHFGEEPELVGRGGSGTIFFSWCNFRCVFCCNWRISQAGEGAVVSLNDLADMMLDLQRRGCVNINVVTPTHRSAHIVRALDLAAGRGLRLPVVYNTNGWENPAVLKALDGIVDIYLPDHKWGDAAMGLKYSGIPDYPAITQAALLEMQRQVATAWPVADGLIRRGLMIRHLVMPNRVAGTRKVLKWIAENLPKDTYVNVMSQYSPTYKAFEHSDIARRITRAEYAEAIEWTKEFGLTRVQEQGFR